MHPLDGPRLKIQRAKKHIHDLEAPIREWRSRDPYELITQVDAETTNKVTRIKVREQPPPLLALIAGDAIHNLRSSLDLLMRQLVLANGGTPTDATVFPIAWNRKKFETRGVRKVKGISSAAMRQIKALKPYRGGNDALWRLHRLDIADKHRLLFTVGLGWQKMTATPDRPSWLPDHVPTPVMELDISKRLFPLEDGTDLFYEQSNVGADFPVPVKFDFTFDVAFGEGEVVQGEPLLPTLVQLAEYVEGVVESFAPLLRV